MPAAHAPAQACEVLIVGAGPHALTMSRYLASRGRTALVVDEDGWCSRWNARMRRLDIEMLRSHHTQHPDPDHYALARFGGDPIEAWAGPWSTPTNELFVGFCRQLVAEHRLDDVLVRDRVLRIAPLAGGLRVSTRAGRELIAERVVFATNPMVAARPSWAGRAATTAPPGRILHSDDLDLRGMRLDGERVLVVGGGLTGANIAVGAVRRGAHATLAARRPLVLRVADAESNWHGPARLRPYFAERDPQRRLRMSRAARAATVTPAAAWELRAAVQAAAAELLEGHEVRSIDWRDDGFDVAIDATTRRFDRIWLATGHRPQDLEGSLLADVARAHPATIVDGLPLLDDACRWPGTNLHVMGALAELQIGPLARNLAGARMAADRILSCIEPHGHAEYPQPPRSAAPALIGELR